MFWKLVCCVGDVVSVVYILVVVIWNVGWWWYCCLSLGFREFGIVIVVWYWWCYYLDWFWLLGIVLWLYYWWLDFGIFFDLCGWCELGISVYLFFVVIVVIVLDVGCIRLGNFEFCVIVWWCGCEWECCVFLIVGVGCWLVFLGFVVILFVVNVGLCYSGVLGFLVRCVVGVCVGLVGC